MLFRGKVCYLGGREAAAYFTGQGRVKNKTTANSTPRVLQGLSMTPSFPLSPKPGSTSPEGLPTPGAVAFGFYANNCLTGNALQPELVSPAPCAPPSSHSVPGLPRALISTFPQTLGAREWEVREGAQVLVPLLALGWQLPAGGGLGTAVMGEGEEECAGVGWPPLPGPLPSEVSH